MVLGGPEFVGTVPGVTRLMTQTAKAPMGRTNGTADLADVDKEIWIVAIGNQQTKRSNWKPDEEIPLLRSPEVPTLPILRLLVH